MPCVHPIGRWLRRGYAAVVALGLGAMLAIPVAPSRAQAKPGPAAEPRVWDAQRILSSAARDELESQLVTAERRGGVPFFVLVTDRLRGEPVADLAARIYAERQLGADPARNAVLLVVAADSGAAAVETGKGSAGIVPELDARRIVKELTANLSPRHPERALGHALPALVAAARATAARRTPLPRPPEDPEPPVSEAVPADAAADDDGPGQSTDAADAADAAAEADAGPPAGAPAEAAPHARRSRVPIAGAIAVLVLVGLGLRRRRQITADRREKPHDSEQKRRRPPF